MIHARPIALLSAVPREAAPLLDHIRARSTERIGGIAVTHGTLGGRAVVLATTGMGKANAAYTLGVLATSTSLGGVIGYGVAGAYPTAGLSVGSLAIAVEAVYADEGVEVPEGWLGAEEMGIPLLENDDDPLYNAFPVDEALLERGAAALAEAGIEARAGRFLTVSTCSGTEGAAARLTERHAGIVEDMESAAIAHIAIRHRLPFLLVRGISNRVGRRDRDAWRIDDAARACATAVQALVGAWGDE